jgi:hypothetical protein
MLQFAEQFPDRHIVVPLARQLSWSHFLILLPLENQDAKLFYANMSINERTDLPPKKELEEKIHTLLIEAKERIEVGKLL